MNRIFHNHALWEDYKNGMYESDCIDSERKRSKSIEILSTPYLFRYYGNIMIEKWIYSAEQNLSNLSRNRQAWVGQATCCFFCGSPEYITKIAWHTLTDIEKGRANNVADEIIERFQKKLYFRYQYSLL